LFGSKFFWAQQEESIEISSFIGEKLDRVERDYFKLFTKIEGFQEAVFYLNPDSTLKVQIVYEKDGYFRDTVLNNYWSPRMIHSHIDQFLISTVKNINNDFKGKVTDVLLIDSTQISGELLSVRQNSVLILGLSKKSYDDKDRVSFNVDNIHESDINNIYFKEKSKTLTIIYPIIGGIAGLIIGYNKQKNSDSKYDMLYEEQVKTFGSAILGMVVGMLASIPLMLLLPIEIESETVFEAPFDEDDIEGLRDNARYEYVEPYYLTKIK
jgi:hypothetical protein